MRKLGSAFGASIGGRELQWIIRGHGVAESPLHVVIGNSNRGRLLLWIIDSDGSLGSQVTPLAVPDIDTVDKVIGLIRTLAGSA